MTDNTKHYDIRETARLKAYANLGVINEAMKDIRNIYTSFEFTLNAEAEKKFGIVQDCIRRTEDCLKII